MHLQSEMMADAVAAKVLSALKNAEAFVVPEYLSARQVAQLTGFSAKILETYRAQKRGPKYFKVGTNIRYRVADVREWMEANPVEAAGGTA